MAVILLGRGSSRGRCHLLGRGGWGDSAIRNPVAIALLGLQLIRILADCARAKHAGEEEIFTWAPLDVVLLAEGASVFGIVTNAETENAGDAEAEVVLQTGASLLALDHSNLLEVAHSECSAAAMVEGFEERRKGDGGGGI